MSDETLSQDLPVPVPVVFPETEPFWGGARKGVLMLPFCSECATPNWYPKAFCNACGSTRLEWRKSRGRGQIYSFTEVRKGEGPYRELASFVLALVDLEEGIRMLTNIIDVAPDGLHIGQPVEVVFHISSAETALPRFKPV